DRFTDLPDLGDHPVDVFLLRRAEAVGHGRAEPRKVGCDHVVALDGGAHLLPEGRGVADSMHEEGGHRHTSFAIRRIASTEASTSPSVVVQFDTEIRIAAT